MDDDSIQIGQVPDAMEAGDDLALQQALALSLQEVSYCFPANLPVEKALSGQIKASGTTQPPFRSSCGDGRFACRVNQLPRSRPALMRTMLVASGLLNIAKASSPKQPCPGRTIAYTQKALHVSEEIYVRPLLCRQYREGLQVPSKHAIFF